MITVVTASGSRCFNLKNFEIEKKVLDAWHAMGGDAKYTSKVFKFTTRDGEILKYRLGEITDCKFREAEYFKADVIGHINDRKKKKKESKQDFSQNFMDILDRKRKTKEESNVKKFMVELYKAGVRPNMDDPFLLKTLESVRKCDSDLKMNMYVNLYKTNRGVR